MNCWTKIAEKFTLNPAEAEKTLKNIRTAYHLPGEGNLPTNLPILRHGDLNEKIKSFK